MTFIKFKSVTYCVGGRHKSATKNIHGDITSKDSNVLIGYCSICKKKGMTVSENTIQAEVLGSFFKNLGKISAKTGKKLATNALENPARFLGIGANVATAAATRNPEAALTALPEVINFYHTGKGLYLGKFVQVFFIINGAKI